MYISLYLKHLHFMILERGFHLVTSFQGRYVESNSYFFLSFILILLNLKSFKNKYDTVSN